MNRVGILLNYHEYKALRALTHRKMQLMMAYYKPIKSTSIDSDIIIASLFESHFCHFFTEQEYGQSVHHFHIYEALALRNTLSIMTDIAYVSVLENLETEIAKWKPSFTAKTFDSWYKAEMMIETFGELDELDEDMLEAFQNYFNNNVLKPSL